ncbi:MAG: aspartate aminotransferase family protein [Cytophagales bacterium]|nr:aspartate aminotransferase family protein [Cytophagales bacterium]
MKKSEKLIARRNAIVPAGLGMFTPLTIESGKGALFRDVDGKEYIDFAGGIGVLNAGHCPPPVIKAIEKQAKKLMHVCFPVAVYEPYVELCETLAALLPHGKSTKVMLTNSGVEAVENAIKIARQATGRPGVICFAGGFHGRTLLGMTLTTKAAYKTGCGPFAPEVYRLPFPNHYQRGQGLSLSEYVKKELDAFDDFLYTEVEGRKVAAIILELVQGEGGFVIAPKEFVRGLHERCKKHGILLIFDEVQTGFGRTGKWAAYGHYDVVPDISTWAKSLGSGLPIGAVIGKAEVMDKTSKGTLGGTYLGNPVACASALATIKYMKKINLNSRGVTVGKTVLTFFKKLQRECPAIGDVRGLGAMVALELVKDGDPDKPDAELCNKLTHACALNGLLIISAGLSGNVIRVLSPLTITPAQLQKGLQILRTQLLRLTNQDSR